MLTVVREDFEMKTFFEKHNTDAFRLYMGPARGWILCIQDVDKMEELSLLRFKETFPKWPSAWNQDVCCMTWCIVHGLVNIAVCLLTLYLRSLPAMLL
jgi:hypothetical protein